ncbi:MAG: type III pantothenate kinase [Betaproteobacteria bacterium]|nr:type III pantothenate kinase [Betaproteobacteria bacterium]
MILAVDAGNTRIKWGLHDGKSWLDRGWVATGDAHLLGDSWGNIAQPDRIVASNVAGQDVANQINEACRRWPIEIHWVTAMQDQCGVHNSYENPAQLGGDRWAALIAARQLAPKGSVVVNVGTAMTVDALSAEGVFLGGLIVPGLATMQRALAEAAAGVETAAGSLRVFPGNTADAVYSGSLAALAGAVDHMVAALAKAQSEAPVCLLSGGDAIFLLPLLSGKVTMVDNLVLDGLIRIAMA